jgi:hypothetical protein
MRSSKTISLILSALILLFALASCNGGNTPAESTKNPSVTTDPAPTSNEGTTEGSPAESTSEPTEGTTGEPVKADWLPAEASIDNRGVLLYATFPSSYTKDAPIAGTLTLKNTTDAPISLSLRVFIGIGEYPDLMGDGSAPAEALVFSDTRESIDSQETYLPVSLAVGEQITVDFSIPTDQNTFADEVVFYYFTIALYESESAQAPAYAFCFPIKQSYAMSRY